MAETSSENMFLLFGSECILVIGKYQNIFFLPHPPFANFHIIFEESGLNAVQKKNEQVIGKKQFIPILFPVT